MKIFIVLILLAISMAFVIPQKNSKNPSWVKNPSKNKEYIYVIGKGSSQNMNMATQKADADARLKIAKEVGKLLKTYTKKSDIIFKNDINYVQSIKTIRTSISATLTGTEIVESNYKIKKDIYTVSINMRLKKTLLKQTFINEIDMDQLMKEKLVKSNLYKEISDMK